MPQMKYQLTMLSRQATLLSVCCSGAFSKKHTTCQLSISQGSWQAT